MVCRYLTPATAPVSSGWNSICKSAEEADGGELELWGEALFYTNSLHRGGRPAVLKVRFGNLPVGHRGPLQIFVGWVS